MQAKTIDQPVDPNLATEQQQARQEQISELQQQASSDTANLMARYGTRLALSNIPMQGISGSPVAGKI